MPRQAHHDMLPRPTHDEDARQAFMLTFRELLINEIGPGIYPAYHKRTERNYLREHGKKPETVGEVRQAMRGDTYFNFWSALQRNSQQMMWSSAADTVERTLPELIDKFREDGKLGSLRLNDQLKIPAYHTIYDIHQMPGGYHSEFTKDDLSVGAVFDIGVPIYALGKLGEYSDIMGASLARFYRESFPDHKPERILDLGCTIGGSTVPWKQAFPDAEVHGVDVGAPVLRWAHARASAMGQEVHFSQQNAECLDFEDDSFDVVTSSILFHETSRSALPKILKECHRVLRPGGRMIHLDAFSTEQGRNREPIAKFVGNWEVDNNNEYFVQGLSQIDIVEEARKAGFTDPDMRIERVELRLDAPKSEPEDGRPKGYLQGTMKSPTLIAVK